MKTKRLEKNVPSTANVNPDTKEPGADQQGLRQFLEITEDVLQRRAERHQRDTLRIQVKRDLIRTVLAIDNPELVHLLLQDLHESGELAMSQVGDPFE